jgi:hypothetical protein
MHSSMALVDQHFPSDDRMTIECIYCHQPQPVSRKAMSLTCKFCHKSLKLQEEPIKHYVARRSVETVGVVTVEKKGTLVSDVLCGGLVVRGKIKGNISSRGPVLVGPEAEIKGNVTAPTLAVGEGAVLQGKYAIGTKPTKVEDPLNPPGVR